MNVRTWLFLFAIFFFAHGAAARDYLARADVQSFIQAMQTEHGFDISDLERVFGAVRYQPTVVRLIGPERKQTAPPPVRSWPAYRAKFLTNGRIAAGVRYWEVYEPVLHRAEAQFGVPSHVVLAILGVETAFGQNTGSFRVLDALATIAFDGPRRQDYFRNELQELLLLARERGLDPLSMKGSYAGAIGLPQFMPSSYRRHAVDFDGDGFVDLVGSPEDAIGSIASYLQAHGWVEGETAKVGVRLPEGSEAELVTGLHRIHSVEALTARGVQFSATTTPTGPASVIELPAPGKPSRYVAGFANFEAITAYNRSSFYATAVLELAEAIHEARTRRMGAKHEHESPPTG